MSQADLILLAMSIGCLSLGLQIGLFLGGMRK